MPSVITGRLITMTPQPVQRHKSTDVAAGMVAARGLLSSCKGSREMLGPLKEKLLLQ